MRTLYSKNISIDNESTPFGEQKTFIPPDLNTIFLFEPARKTRSIIQTSPLSKIINAEVLARNLDELERIIPENRSDYPSDYPSEYYGQKENCYFKSIEEEGEGIKEKEQAKFSFKKTAEQKTPLQYITRRILSVLAKTTIPQFLNPPVKLHIKSQANTKPLQVNNSEKPFMDLATNTNGSPFIRIEAKKNASPVFYWPEVWTYYTNNYPENNVDVLQTEAAQELVIQRIDQINKQAPVIKTEKNKDNKNNPIGFFQGGTIKEFVEVNAFKKIDFEPIAIINPMAPVLRNTSRHLSQPKEVNDKTHISREKLKVLRRKEAGDRPN